ncbi:MAG: ferritin [Pseudomonadota bacterium]
MLSETVNKALNEQINAELYSSYLYYAMAAYFDDTGLPGASHWMKTQAVEEMLHAHKFFGYVADRAGRVLLERIEKPQESWASPLAAFEAAYAHEVKITGLINGLVKLARQESDFNTDNFLQWFVAEQVEEEATANDVIQKLKLVDQSKGGLFMIDRELATRTIVLPPEVIGA